MSTETDLRSMMLGGDSSLRIGMTRSAFGGK